MLAPDVNLGPYRLIARIGAGGMGEVWKGEDTRLGRVVAIKVLPPAVASDAEAVARLKREARTAAQLYHANVATIHSIEEHEGQLFIVEEFVEGEQLTKLIARGAMPEAEICRIGRGVADALAEAHAKGIVHRDIKPDNIIVSGQRVKVLDFGIAKQIGLVSATASGTGDAATAPLLTQQGMILGTIHYMSPEQALGKPLDSRTDLFSLGVVLYEAATGRLPFGGETITETMTQIIRDEPPALTAASPGLASIIARCLKKNREERFRDANELSKALERQAGKASTEAYSKSTAPTVLSAPATVIEPAVRKKSMRPWIGAIVAVAIAIAYLMTRPRPEPKLEPVVTTTTAPPPAASTVEVTPPVVTETKPPVAAAQELATQLHQIKHSETLPVTTTTAPRPPAPAPAPARPSADQLFAEATSQMAARQFLVARDTLLRVVDTDPHYARAHFRLGDMALAARQFDDASREMQLAIGDRDRLDARESAFADLGLAIAQRDRPRAEQLARALRQQYPHDPELNRWMREFGGAPRDVPGGPPRGGFRPRRRPF
jgi:serine/threonine protein kinase